MSMQYLLDINTENKTERCHDMQMTKIDLWVESHVRDVKEVRDMIWSNKQCSDCASKRCVNISFCPCLGRDIGDEENY